MKGSLPKLVTSALCAFVAADGLAAQRPAAPRPAAARPVQARPASPAPRPGAMPQGIPVVPQPGLPTRGGPQGPSAMPNCGASGLVLPTNPDPSIGTVAADGRETRAAVKKVRGLEWSKTLRKAERESKLAGGKPILFIQAYGDLAGYS